MRYVANAQSESNQEEDSTLVPGILTAVRGILMESEGLKSGNFPLFDFSSKLSLTASTAISVLSASAS